MFSQFAILDIGTPELLVILAIALLLFGGKKLPELSRSMGQSVAEFKKSAGHAADMQQELRSQANQVKEQLTASNKQ